MTVRPSNDRATASGTIAATDDSSSGHSCGETAGRPRAGARAANSRGVTISTSPTVTAASAVTASRIRTNRSANEATVAASNRSVA